MFRPVAPPVADLIDPNDAAFRQHLRLDHTDDDLALAGYVRAALAHLDGPRGVLGRCLITQTWALDFPGFASDFDLRLPNVQSAVVKYHDSAGSVVTLSAPAFDLVPYPTGDWLVFRDTGFPDVQASRALPVSIEVTAGFGDTVADVPADIVQAAQMLAAHWFQRREAVAEGVSVAAVPMGVKALLAPHRAVGV